MPRNVESGEILTFGCQHRDGLELVHRPCILNFVVITFRLLLAADSKFLKTLLSFAVGGLLGDVFLHLLPEAWEYDMKDRNGN